MNQTIKCLAISLLLSAGWQGSSADEHAKTLISAANPGSQPGKQANSNDSQQSQPQTSPGAVDAGAAAEQPQARSYYSSALEEAAKQYKANPGPAGYMQLLQGLKSLLSSAPAARLSVAVILKDNPYLADLRPQLSETGNLRIWSFPKAADRSKWLVQWTEVHQQVIGSGRRKKVVNTSSVHFQIISLSQSLNLKDAGMISIKDIGKFLILSGDNEDGSLSLRAYKWTESGWQESSEFANQVPAFLLDKVSGRVSFKGSDLIFNIGKMIEITDTSGKKRYLPEAESATYKFWLKYTEQGYAIASALPDEDALWVVYQFMKAVSQSRQDQQKALLLDPHVSSLPKYLGLQGKAVDSAARIVQMSVPSGKGQRFRLINLAKNDLIFDVGKTGKNQWQIKAIFVAAPDPFLSETARYFPLYSQFQAKLEQLEKQEKSETQSSAGTSPAAAAKKK